MMGGALTWSPLLPWPAIAVLGGVGVILLLLAARRRARGTIWRTLALILLVVALAEPRLVSEDHAAQTDIAVVAVDTSPSQRTGERREQARQALAEIRDRLAGETDLEVRTIEVPGAGPDGSEGTPMIGALEREIADIPADRFAGAVMITDGQVHDVPENTAARPGPLHLLLTGERDETDRRMVIENVPSYGLVGKEISVVYRVEDHPRPDANAPPPAARVTLRRDGEVLAEQPVSVGGEHEITLTLEHAGPTVIELEAEPLDGELSQVNNRAAVAVNGVRDRLRVLLVSGQPHLGERTWRNLLKSDPAVDLVHFTILRPPDKDDFTPLRELALIAFPTQELFEKRIEEFDLIVFDRYVVRHVLPPVYFDNIVTYVREGGAVLLAVGPEFSGLRSLAQTPLVDILPVKPTGEVLETGFRPRTSAVGRRHPVTASLPRAAVSADVDPAWGPWFRQIEGLAEAGNTLMEGPGGAPLVILDRVGEGRVAQVMSDQIWLWARGYAGGGPHAEVVRRLAHWLMKEPELEEEALRATTRDGNLFIERTSLEEDPVSVTVTSPSGTEQTVELEPGAAGRSSATLPVEEPGLYRVEDGTQTVLAAVGALNAPELADLRATPERLQPLVEVTGGGIHWISEGIPDLRRTLPGRDSKGRDWVGLTRNGAQVVTGIAQVPLLPWWLVLPLGLGLLGMGWWREGR